MLSETSAAVRASLRALKPGWDVDVRAFPGTGICTWLDEMRTTDAQAVALLFTGVVFTDCILNRRKWPEAYLSDAMSAASIFRAKGTEVIWLGWPRPARNVVSPHLDDTIWHYYEQVAADYGERVADPGMALFDPATRQVPDDDAVPHARRARVCGRPGPGSRRTRRAPLPVGRPERSVPCLLVGGSPVRARRRARGRERTSPRAGLT